MISVIMGVLADDVRLPEVKRAVYSILDQTEYDLELLICDNGSSVNVTDWLTNLSKKDNRLRLIREPATTLPQKLNLCLKYANGQYVARMDDDDYSYPNRFEKQIQFLSEHPDCAIVGANIRQVSNEHESIRILPEYPVLRDFRMTFPFIHSVLMFRREILTLVAGYSLSHWQLACDDYDLMLRIYEHGAKGANIQEVLLEYSILNSQLKRRPYIYYINECVTRFARFRALHLLPLWIPYAIKPLIIGVFPRRLVFWVKKYFAEKNTRVALCNQEGKVLDCLAQKWRDSGTGKKPK